jgi:hypothetical protein
MLLDIGDTELSAGLSYVGASRSNHPRRYCVHPFPTEKRFNRIGAMTSNAKEDAKQRGELQRREAACQRLGVLARRTIASYQELYDWCAANCKGGRESGDGAGNGPLLTRQAQPFTACTLSVPLCPVPQCTRMSRWTTTQCWQWPPMPTRIRTMAQMTT